MTNPPSQIGPYTVDRELGRGGMGVVYQGHDTRLNRTVAIKALPQDLAADPVRLERFEREARVLAQLNHPNIAGIHGVEVHDGARYLVLEFVEGQDLSELIDKGPLPPDEAVSIAIQIAKGVEAAHEAGVIHRDLKPANIKITSDGQVKVLDFGLARTEEGQSSTGQSEAATLTSPAFANSPTIPGVILGTAAYMSPEQARGRRVDKRTDIWSFGVVLYEMLTGIGPFRGETVTDSIGAILHKDIDLNQIPPTTPANVRHVIQRCLVRDKTQRLQSIGDARIDLARAGDEQEQHSATPASPLRWTLVALLVLLAGAAGVIIQRAMTPEPTTEGPLHVSIPIGTSPRIDSGGAFDLSPITRTIAYIATDPDDPSEDGTTWVFLRDLNTREPRRLVGTQHAQVLRYSPDGTQIAFVWSDPASNRKEVRRISVNGGPALTVYTDRQGDLYQLDQAPVWTTNEQILALSQDTKTWHTVPVTGGTPTKFATLSSDGNWVYNWPTGMINERSILISRGKLTTQAFETSLFSLDLNTGESALLLENAREGVLLPDGRLLFVRDSTICLTRFDHSTGAVAGGITPILPVLDNRSPFSISPKGDLCTVGGGTEQSFNRLMSINRDGVSEVLIETEKLFFGWLTITADGRTVALSTQYRRGGAPEAQTVDLETGFIRPVSTTHGVTLAQGRAPNGRLAFINWMSPTHGELVLIDPSVPSSAETPLIEPDAKGYQSNPTFTPDGRYMVFEYSVFDQQTEGGIYAVDLQAPDSERTAFEVIVTSAEEDHPAISPNGRWIAYTTDASGKPQVVLRPLDLENPQRRVREFPVSFEGGYFPFWSLDGTELFFLGLESGHVMGVQFTDEPEFRLSPPQKIFDASLLNRLDGSGRSIDIMPDGERFVYIEDSSISERPTSLDLTLNWLEELDQISK